MRLATALLSVVLAAAIVPQAARQRDMHGEQRLDHDLLRLGRIGDEVEGEHRRFRRGRFLVQPRMLPTAALHRSVNRDHDADHALELAQI